MNTTIEQLIKKAQAAQIQGDLISAINHYEEAAYLQENNGASDSELAKSYNYIMHLYDAIESPADSIIYAFKELAIYEKNFPPDHINLANLTNNIAVMYGYQLDWENALKYQQKALTIFRKSLSYDDKSIVEAIETMNQFLLGARHFNGEEWTEPYEDWLDSFEFHLALGDDED